MSTPSTGHRAWQYNFAFLDEHTKRMIRRGLLKAVAENPRAAEHIAQSAALLAMTIFRAPLTSSKLYKGSPIAIITILVSMRPSAV